MCDMLVEYTGELGTFSYDPEDYIIIDRVVGGKMRQVLKYYGSNYGTILVPEGVVDLSYCFERSSITAVPVIPNSVRIMNFTFKDCLFLKSGVCLPYNVESCTGLYQNCTSLIMGSSMPDTVTNAASMYSGCISLLNPGYLSSLLQETDSMFENCRNLRAVPEFAPTVVKGDNMFRGCTFIDRSYKIYMY